MSTLTLNNKEYNIDKLNDKAKAQVTTIKVVEQEIAIVNNHLKIAQTARRAYGLSLASNLPSKEAHANKKKDVISVDGKRYDTADFNDKALHDAQSMAVVDKKIAALKIDISIFTTAKNAYVQVLEELIK